MERGLIVIGCAMLLDARKARPTVPLGMPIGDEAEYMDLP